MIHFSDIATIAGAHSDGGGSSSSGGGPGPATASRLFLRILRAAQPISRIEIANRLGVNRSTVTDISKPLIAAGIVREDSIPPPVANGNRSLGRPRISLSFNSRAELFAGVHIGVRGSQVGLTTLDGQIIAEEDIETLSGPQETMALLRASLGRLCAKFPDRKLQVIGVSVPGVTDSERSKLVYAPHLGWRDVAIADELQINSDHTVTVVVENDATAAAMYEARLRLGKTSGGGVLKDFVLVRSGTGIGVGLVIGGEAYRGVGKSEGIAGEFGHMTIVAGGKLCACGNRGCWEQYGAAAAASPLYMGDRLQLGSAKRPPRYVEIVDRAEAGEIRAQRTLERIGEYLGIGIANVITGLGVPHVILSGRIVYGWKFIREPLKKAVGQSMAGKLSDWSVEAGERRGAGLGGALEVAVEEFLTYGFNHVI